MPLPFSPSVRCCRVAPGRNQPISLAAAGAPFSSAPVEAAAAAFVADARLFAPAESVAAASALLFSQPAVVVAVGQRAVAAPVSQLAAGVVVAPCAVAAVLALVAALFFPALAAWSGVLHNRVVVGPAAAVVAYRRPFAFARCCECVHLALVAPPCAQRVAAPLPVRAAAVALVAVVAPTVASVVALLDCHARLLVKDRPSAALVPVQQPYCLFGPPADFRPLRTPDCL